MQTNRVRFLAGLIALLWVYQVSAGEPITIASGEGVQAPRQPQALIAADGTVHLVYGMNQEVFYCKSPSGSEKFDQPKSAFRVPNMSLGMRRGPRIANVGNSIVVTAIGGEQGKGRDGDVMAWRTSDNGKSWMGPTRVNDAPGSAREGLHSMASSIDGSVWCTWLDLRNNRTEIFAAKSSDGGATWLPNVLVYRSPDGSVCECCHPSIVASGNAVHIMFRNNLAGNRDMYVATSVNGAQDFSSARKLGLQSWKLEGCPMDGGMLGVESDGSISTVWRRGNLVYTSKGNKGGDEILLGKGEQPWLASTVSGSVAIWTASREGELFLKNLSTVGEPIVIASLARDPMIASASDGKGPLIACWESKQNAKSVVMAVRIDPNPNTVGSGR